MLLPSLADEAARLPAYVRSKFVTSAMLQHKDPPGGDDDDDDNDDSVASYNTRTEMWLRTGMAEEWRRFQVFLSIPRQMLESIVLGTVAWDYDNSRGHARDNYKEQEGFGIYVIGLSVQGRDGAWLTARELTRLVVKLERYLRGFEAWDANKQWVAGAEDLRDFVAQIDNEFGIYNKNAPRFVTSSGGLESMKDLVKSLKERANKSLGMSANGDEPLIQSPLYVGMSVEPKQRMPQHSLDVGLTGTLKGSSKSYGLVCSLMKRMNRKPLSTCLCVVRVPEKEDLPFTETLVSALANSLICQDGFNRTECGDVPTDKKKRTDDEGEAYVMQRARFLFDNSCQVLRDVRERVDVMEASAQLKPLLDNEMAGDVAEIESGCDLLQQANSRLRRKHEKLQKLIRVTEANEKTLEQDSLLSSLL